MPDDGSNWDLSQPPQPVPPAAALNPPVYNPFSDPAFAAKYQQALNQNLSQAIQPVQPQQDDSFLGQLSRGLSNPGVQALFGLAQGFGQAAMPTRMPTPIGAVLGMGAGGMSRGLATGMEMQGAQNQQLLQQQQLQQERLKNVMGMATMPGQIAQANWQAQLYSPDFLDKMAAGMKNPGVTGPGGVQPTGTAATPLPIPPRGTGGPGSNVSAPTEWMPYFEAASKETGIPVDLLIAQARQESSFNANAKGDAGEIGLFQIKPTTAASPGFGMTGVDPKTITGSENVANNIMFGARYLKAQMHGGDPNDPAVQAAALHAYNGGGDKNYVANVFRYRPTLSPSDPANAVTAYTPPALNADGTPAPYKTASTAPVGPPSATGGSGGTTTPARGTAPPAPGTPEALAATFHQRALEETALADQLEKNNRFVQSFPESMRGVIMQQLAARGVQFGDPSAHRSQANMWEQQGAELLSAGPKAGARSAAQVPYQMMKDGWTIQNGRMVPIPNGPADPAYVSQKAAAEAAAQAMNKVTVDRNNNVYYGTTWVGRGPMQIYNPQTDRYEMLGPQGAVAPPAPAGTPPTGVPGVPVGEGPGTTGATGAPGATGGAGGGEGGGPGGGGPIVLKPGPGGEKGLTERQAQAGHDYKRDQDDAGKLLEEGTEVQRSMMSQYAMRDLVNRISETGSGGGSRADMANFVETYLKPILGSTATKWIENMGRLPDASLAQELAKLTTQAAGLQEKSTVGARGSLGLTELMLKNNPGLNTQQDANKVMANFLLAQNQANLDYVRGYHDYITKAAPQYRAGGGYTPASEGFDQKWLSEDNQKNYVAAAMAMSGRPMLGDTGWAKILGDPNSAAGKASISTVIGIMRRIDPTATIVWNDGKAYPITAPGGQ